LDALQQAAVSKKCGLPQTDQAKAPETVELAADEQNRTKAE
jgi:hypothetical protein